MQTNKTNTMQGTFRATVRKAAFSAAAALTFAIAMPSMSHAQLPMTSGVKKIALNDQVNKNQFIWVSEAPLENIKGSSEGVAGTFTFDAQDLSTLHGTVTTAVKTMKTGNATRDNHLVSSEWLNASKYPTITFTIDNVSSIATNAGGASGLANGSFTMHGVTKKMSVPFQMSYINESPKTRERAPGDLVMINANFDIALADFNIAGTEGVVGSKVGSDIKIKAQLFGTTTGAQETSSAN